MGNASVIYKENQSDFYIMICKKQTCSDKLKDINQVDEYLKYIV